MNPDQEQRNSRFKMDTALLKQLVFVTFKTLIMLHWGSSLMSNKMIQLLMCASIICYISTPTEIY